jgi:hypothetical protein
MHRLATAASLLLLAVSGASAEQPEKPALKLRVRAPDGDAGQEARIRQEQLLRRMQESEYRFCSICLYCGGHDRWAGTAPFEPAAALAPSPPRPLQDRPEAGKDGAASAAD